MTTTERIALLARAYPKEFPQRGLRELVRRELGDLRALDGWVERDGLRTRARPPRLIYHICAGNLAVSARTSLVHGLLLGAKNVIKLPSAREDSETRQDIVQFIRRLPPPLQKLVETHSARDEKLMDTADVIVAFGSDATMEKIRAGLRPGQRFIAHGHAVSLLWVERGDRLTPRELHACAVDVLTYDQLGCLSPQAIYATPSTKIEMLGRGLAHALESVWQNAQRKPARGLAIAARIGEARDVAFARGHHVWLPPDRHLGWTVLHNPDPVFKISPLHGVISIRLVSEPNLPRALAPIAGRISAVGLAGKTSSRSREAFLSVGVSRFCPAGRMQFPPLTWHHDGRPTLADLVTWIDDECP